MVRACLNLTQATGIFNVFHVSAFVPGSIYIEADNALQVRGLVDSLPDVFSNQQFEFVPQEDVVSLWHLGSVRLTVGTWARVTGNGRYRNNICSVIKVDDDQNAMVLLVPRTELSHRPKSKASKGKGKDV